MHGITAGLLAEQIGVFRCYSVLILVTAIALVIAPQTASYMPHDGASSSGKSLIMLICVWCDVVWYDVVEKRIK
jgi:hypothetical protein